MKLHRTLAFALPLLAALAVPSADALACGGCFGPPPLPGTPDTQVTGHRMILSVSPDATTLYDQFEYTGSPESFAWVLPIQGQVDVGLSADGLFSYLNEDTLPVALPPPLDCPPIPAACLQNAGAESASSGATGGMSNGGVQVLTQEVVGPYEVVQLASTDAEALRNWLEAHGYSIPDDIAPVVSAYVSEGFNFLAMKLVPGQAVTAMRPVRVTTPGAGIGLPLRMVAAGTGAVTKVTLWVIGEGRYETTNFANVRVKPEEVIWDWDANASNLVERRDAALAEKEGLAWLTEAATPYSTYGLSQRLSGLSSMAPPYTPEAFGYLGDPANNVTPEQELAEDMAHLFGSIPPENVWVTRLHAQLPRLALGTDLTVGASKTQDQVSNVFQTTKAVGQPPLCPDYSWCADGQGSSSSGGFGKGSGVLSDETESSCSASAPLGSGSWSSGWLLGLGLVGIGFASRRRKA